MLTYVIVFTHTCTCAHLCTNAHAPTQTQRGAAFSFLNRKKLRLLYAMVVSKHSVERQKSEFGFW